MTVFLILFISFIASLVRSSLGFGESLLAVPLFLFFLPVEIAVPLSVMLSIVIALVIVIQDYEKIYFRSAKWLILYAIPGIPLGLVLLLYGNDSLVKIILGILIVGYSIFSLSGRIAFTISTKDKAYLLICGLLSGVLGGAYGLNGPPLVVYGNFKQWSPRHFRATLQAYFLPTSFVGFCAYYYNGLVKATVLEYFLVALISAVPAIFIGRFLNRHLKYQVFFRYVYGGLILIGIMLIVFSLLPS